MCITSPAWLNVCCISVHTHICTHSNVQYEHITAHTQHTKLLGGGGWHLRMAQIIWSISEGHFQGGGDLQQDPPGDISSTKLSHMGGGGVWAVARSPKEHFPTSNPSLRGHIQVVDNLRYYSRTPDCFSNSTDNEPEGCTFSDAHL